MISSNNLTNFKKYYKNKTILITGYNGFIGTNILQVLSLVDCNIILFSRSKKKKISLKTKSNVKYIFGSYNNIAIWNKIIKKIDIIFHLAGQTSSNISNKNPKKDFDSNVMPMKNILESARDKNNKKLFLVFSGTVTQYGLHSKSISELTLSNPITFYDLHKLLSEKILFSYINQGFLNGVSLRLSNVYGPGKFSSNGDRNIINQMIKKIIKNKPISFYLGSGFSRDYVYIDDVVLSFLFSPILRKKINGKVVNISTGTKTNIKSLSNKLKKLSIYKFKRNLNYFFINKNKKIEKIEKRDYKINNNYFKKIFKEIKITSFFLGLKLTAEYYLKIKK